MQMFFISDKNSENCSYQDLLNFLNEPGLVIKNPYQISTLNLFKNIIKSLIHNVDLILLDNDFRDSEISSLTGDKYIENSVFVVGLGIDSIKSCLQLIIDSKSRITIYTSGTTGLPKKVVHTVGSLTRGVITGSNFESAIWGLAFNPTHMAGLQVFFQALFNNNTLVDLFNIDTNTANDLILRHRISHISATPTFYRLLNYKDLCFMDVRSVTMGGEKSDVSLYRIVKKMFPLAKIKNIYASTEAGSLLCSDGEFFYIPERFKDKIIVKEEVLFIHESLMGDISDFFTFEDGWYCTGDVIEWQHESSYFFRLIGKANEMINVGGYKVNPHEVEFELRSIDGICNALVFGKANSVLGNIICAEIVLEEGFEILESKIKDVLRKKLQLYKVPRKIIFVDSLNLSRTGKISRTYVRK
jgi:acyl-coenzyme A synthetase/AMP-(fatty) acid ligase